MNDKKDIIVKAFTSSIKWNEWLSKNYAKFPNGIWLRLYKKDSGKKTISYDEALDEALCFGWIDSQKNKYDEISWIQKFSQRRSKSIWSKRNRTRVEILIKEKRMHPSGLKEIENAQKDGRWDEAYDSPSKMEIPSDFLEILSKDKTAYVFFKSLNKANLYAIG